MGAVKWFCLLRVVWVESALLAEVGQLARKFPAPPKGTPQIFLAICPLPFCWSRLRQPPQTQGDLNHDTHDSNLRCLPRRLQ